MREVRSEILRATVTIKVSGKLFVGHLEYLDQLVVSAAECELWPLLNLGEVHDLDRAALCYLMNGVGRDFAIVACPRFIQEWMDHERWIKAA